jgi:hypothetical protein|tara:strand:- start:8464 stop:8655 length:192 start_codon:yes stop_codon:yes gene_type:complete
MQPGDLIKVKSIAAYGNTYMQSVAGWEGLLLSFENNKSQKSTRCIVLIRGKTYHVLMHDLELL